MEAKIAAAVPLSSPAAAQRCAEGAGLDSGAAAAAQSAMPSIAPLPQTTFPTGDAARCGAPAPLPNLHQLDGRDLLTVLVPIQETRGAVPVSYLRKSHHMMVNSLEILHLQRS